MAAEIRTFTCLSDNFGYLIHDNETKATASIDARSEEHTSELQSLV